ncbi:MAG: dTDP-glucose 4,6-dehydratase [Pseudomonadota bacterium]
MSIRKAPRNILVTGGCGFIGSAVCRYLSADPQTHVVNLDVLTYAAEPRSLEVIKNCSNYTFVKGDINDIELVFELLRKHKITGVMNLAAESHVDRSIDGPEVFLKTNVLGTYSMLQAARQYLTEITNVSENFRFLHVSTDEVFGDLNETDPAFDEETAYRPSSPYSASKASSDHLVRAWGRTYDLPVLITNCSNNYGPFQFPEKLIPLMIINALSDKELPVYGDGSNIRDWLYVDDHAKALELVLDNGRIGETYNIGGNSERRNLEIVKLICDVLDELSPRNDGQSYRKQIKFVKDRPGHDHRYAVCSKKTENQLGWSTNFTFEEGLRETIIWYLENQAWWAPLIKRNKS